MNILIVVILLISTAATAGALPLVYLTFGALCSPCGSPALYLSLLKLTLWYFVLFFKATISISFMAILTMKRKGRPAPSSRPPHKNKKKEKRRRSSKRPPRSAQPSQPSIAQPSQSSSAQLSQPSSAQPRPHKSSRRSSPASKNAKHRKIPIAKFTKEQIHQEGWKTPGSSTKVYLSAALRAVQGTDAKDAKRQLNDALKKLRV